jgi:hypothetical protein
MVRNATKLYYPIRASIESVLPIVDEFIVALGNCDPGDRTLEEIQGIQSDKVKIIHTEWDLETYKGGSEYARQTDIAKQACTGDWLFYVQSDEVIHEKYLPVIQQRCADLLNDREVEGLLFDYVHFWGDYNHYLVSHVWYPKEIRIIRNDPDIHSWRDAQSFRKIPGFDGRDYFQKENTYKLKVASANAAVYHYGWVRPPHLMQKKQKSFVTDLKGSEQANAEFRNSAEEFDYGDLSRLREFTGTHPAVMRSFIQQFNWGDKLLSGKRKSSEHKHDKFKYRLLTFIEQNLLRGKQLWVFENYTLLKR